MAESVRVFGGGDPQKEKEWRDLYRNLHTNPDSPEAKAAMKAALEGEKNSSDPNRRAHAERSEALLGLDARIGKEADLKESKAAAQVAAKASALDDFNSPTTATGGEQQPKTGGSATPQTPERPQTGVPRQAAAASGPKPSG